MVVKQWFFKSLIYLSFFVGVQAFAFEEVKQEIGFVNSPMNIGSGQIFKSAVLMTEEEWNSDPSSGLFRPTPGYKSLKEYNPIDGGENMEVIATEVAFSVPKGVGLAFFNSKSPLELLQLGDSGFVHSVVDPQIVNSEYAAMNNQMLESARSVLLLKRDREDAPITEEEYQQAMTSLDQLNQVNSQKKWCSSPSDECLKSELVFGGRLQFVIDGIRAAPDVFTSRFPIPTQIDIMNEVSKSNVSDPNWNGEYVSGIPYSPILQMVQTGILATNLIQFSKIIVSIHEYSEDRLLVVMQGRMALESDDLDKFSLFSARSFLMSQAYTNKDEGAARGIPKLQVYMATKLKAAIEGGATN